jgi:hypothetical protein
MSCRIDWSKGNRRHRCSRAHEELVDGYRSARAAQDARAEAWSLGYARELAEFYRDVEPSLTFRDWLLGQVDHTRQAYEEQAA